MMVSVVLDPAAVVIFVALAGWVIRLDQRVSRIETRLEVMYANIVKREDKDGSTVKSI